MRGLSTLLLYSISKLFAPDSLHEFSDWPAMSERSESNGASGTPVKLFLTVIREIYLKTAMAAVSVLALCAVPS